MLEAGSDNEIVEEDLWRPKEGAEGTEGEDSSNSRQEGKYTKYFLRGLNQRNCKKFNLRSGIF